MRNDASIGASGTVVDVHHHVLPPLYLEALEGLGVDTSTFPVWTPRQSIQFMDDLGIDRAILSISSPGVWFGDPQKARSLARRCNEYLGHLKERFPERFGGLGVLPLPDLEGSRKELAFVMDTLGLDGVILYSNVAGRHLGEPEFRPLMADLHGRKARVLLHPNHLPPGDRNAPLYPWAEYPVDLARAYARLVHQGILVRFPEIRWILAHAGGVVPFMAERLGKTHYLKGERVRWGRIILDLLRNRDGGLRLAQSLGYDTVGAGNSVTRASLFNLVGPEKVFFGSNYPWEGRKAVEGSLRSMLLARQGQGDLFSPSGNDRNWEHPTRTPEKGIS